MPSRYNWIEASIDEIVDQFEGRVARCEMAGRDEVNDQPTLDNDVGTGMAESIGLGIILVHLTTKPPGAPSHPGALCDGWPCRAPLGSEGRTGASAAHRVS